MGYAKRVVEAVEKFDAVYVPQSTNVRLSPDACTRIWRSQRVLWLSMLSPDTIQDALRATWMVRFAGARQHPHVWFWGRPGLNFGAGPVRTTVWSLDSWIRFGTTLGQSMHRGGNCATSYRCVRGQNGTVVELGLSSIMRSDTSVMSPRVITSGLMAPSFVHASKESLFNLLD
jgi:hypothetical protein